VHSRRASARASEFGSLCGAGGRRSDRGVRHRIALGGPRLQPGARHRALRGRCGLDAVRERASEAIGAGRPRSIASKVSPVRRYLSTRECSNATLATGSWRHSMGLRAQFAARLTSATRFGAAVSRSDVASMPAR
jgi:hypothetical protein